MNDMTIQQQSPTEVYETELGEICIEQSTPGEVMTNRVTFAPYNIDALVKILKKAKRIAISKIEEIPE